MKGVIKNNQKKGDNMADYKLKYGLTMGAGHSMMAHAKDINDDVLKEMDKLAKRDAGKYEPAILTRHIEEAIKNINA